MSGRSTYAWPFEARYRPAARALGALALRSVGSIVLTQAHELHWTVDGGRERNGPRMNCFKAVVASIHCYVRRSRGVVENDSKGCMQLRQQPSRFESCTRDHRDNHKGTTGRTTIFLEAPSAKSAPKFPLAWCFICPPLPAVSPTKPHMSCK